MPLAYPAEWGLGPTVVLEFLTECAWSGHLEGESGPENMYRAKF